MISYTTHITFEDGSTAREDTTDDFLRATIRRLIFGPAAQMGIIKEVKIVDVFDCIVFLAQQKQGKNLPEIIFPTPQEIEDAK